VRKRLSHGQRIVLSVGLAWVFVVAGSAIISRGAIGGGWFGYTPLAESTYFVNRRTFFSHPNAQTAVWLILGAIWTAVSLWLFAPHHDE
jgi:hypothetical protein